MAFEDYFKNFAADKRKFFAEVKTKEGAKAKAKQHNFQFLAPNEKLLRKEYELLWNRLQKGDIDHDIFWLYCYYCCILLQNYHRAYGQTGKSDEFLKLRKDIKARLNGDVSQPPKKNEPTKKKHHDNFFEYLGKKISASLIELLKAPTKVSSVRDWVSAANLHRIYWFFCRTTITKSFLLARELEMLDRIGSFFGKKIDVDRIVAILESPNPALKVLSVGFFAFRFILNAAMLIKHTHGSEEEQARTWELRLWDEVYKRHAVMVNDLIWGAVNFITNYNTLVGIPDPTAGWILVGFLFFDFCWLIWQRHLAEKEYLAKRSQLSSDWDFYNDLLDREVDEKGEALTSQKRDELNVHTKLLVKQLEQLEINWNAESGYFWFNSTAAQLLAVGFSASMILTPPVMVLACYAICIFALGMFLSAGTYKEREEKRLQLEHAKPKDIDEAFMAYNAAQNEFIFTMVKNVVVPSLFIATFAICWQAAVVITAVYGAYQLYSTYDKYEKQKQLEDNSEGTEPELGQSLNVSDKEQLVLN